VTHQRNRELTAEITELREQIAILYGRLRDVELRGRPAGGREVRQVEPAERLPKSSARKAAQQSATR
jgi:hypothetical protein